MDRRIAALMGLPQETGEGLQVLRYGPGARSEPHFDFLMTTNTASRESIARSDLRVSTLVMYLNDPVAGGEAGRRPPSRPAAWSPIRRNSAAAHIRSVLGCGRLPKSVWQVRS